MVALLRKYPDLFFAGDERSFALMQSKIFTESEKDFIQKFIRQIRAELNPDLEDSELIKLLISREFFGAEERIQLLKAAAIKFRAISRNDVDSREALLKHASYFYALKASCTVGTYGKTPMHVKRELEIEFRNLNDAYTIVFNEAMKAANATEKPWILLQEIGMLRRIRLENQTREQETRIDEYISVLNSRFAKVVTPDTIKAYQVLEALFVDQDLRSAYVAYYNTPTRTGQPRDQNVAASIEQLYQYVKENKKSQLQLLVHEPPEKLHELLDDYRRNIKKVESELYKSSTNINEIYKQRFDLALKFDLCKEIEVLIIVKQSPEFKEFYDNIQQELQNYIENYSKIDDQKLIAKLKRYTQIADKDISFTSQGMQANKDIIFARFLVREIKTILYKDRKIGDENAMQQSPGKQYTKPGNP